MEGLIERENEDVGVMASKKEKREMGATFELSTRAVNKLSLLIFVFISKKTILE